MKKMISLCLLSVFGAGCVLSPEPIPTPQPTPTATTPTTAPKPATTPTTTTSAPAPTTKTPSTTTKPKTGTSNSLQPNAGTVKPGQATIVVNITSTGFSPQYIAVNIGDTVKWVNKDTSNHTVMTSASALWNSGNIPAGSSYARKFSAAGSYAYVDGAHPNFTGTVVVR